MSTTKFRDVAEAAADLAGDKGAVSRVQEEIVKNSLVSLLIQVRTEKGVTQEQVAEAMDCDPSTVSRIESDSDRQLKWSHIVGYAKALKIQMSIIFDDSDLPAADRIKHCVLSIDQDLKKLAELSHEVGGDDEIAQEINRFYRQVLWNFLARFTQNWQSLPTLVIPSCPATPTLCDSESPKKSELSKPRDRELAKSS